MALALKEMWLKPLTFHLFYIHDLKVVGIDNCFCNYFFRKALAIEWNNISKINIPFSLKKAL